MNTLKFQPFVSVLDPSFWSQFANDKLHIYKLDASDIPLTLSYTNSVHSSIPPRLCAYADYSFSESKRYAAVSIELCMTY